MEQLKRDGNHVPVKGASSDSDVFNLYVEPATDELLVVIYPVSDVAPTTGEYTNKAKRDQNHVTCTLAVTDDSDETVTSLITSTEAGKEYLFCDVTT